MQCVIFPGTYVLAVSGGVDSMVLLDALSGRPDVALLVAHFDHGMRTDSADDAAFVRDQAARRGLEFVTATGNLGSAASEATARNARYGFLRGVASEYRADAIITAHHQDDVLETAILNLSRGTGRRGLTSLASTPALQRPLLEVPKADLLDYAQAHKLSWREDASNTDQRYLRNYIRHSVVPRLAVEQRRKLLSIIGNQRRVNAELDEQLNEVLNHLTHDNQLDRWALLDLPVVVVREILISWWRNNGFLQYESKTLLRAIHDLYQGRTGATIPLKAGYSMSVHRDTLALNIAER